MVANSRRSTDLPGAPPQDSDLADRSSEVALHQVSGKPAEATTPGAPRRGSHLRVYLDGTARLSCILWPIPTLPKRPLALVLVNAWWRAPGASGAGENVVDAGRRPSGPWLLLGGRGGNTLVTVHADAPHLRRCWSRRGKRVPPAGAVASQVAGRSGKPGLPRPPSPPGSRLTLMLFAGLRVWVMPVHRGRWKDGVYQE